MIMKKITFDQLPEMVELILNKLEKIESILENPERDTFHNKAMLTSIEAANFMNVSMSFLYKLTSRREIPTYKPNGKKLYFQKCDIIAWILRNKQATEREIDQLANEYVAKYRF